MDITLAEKGKLRKSMSAKRWRLPDSDSDSQRPSKFSPTSPVFAASGYESLDRTRKQQLHAQTINSALLNCVCKHSIKDVVSCREMTFTLERG